MPLATVDIEAPLDGADLSDLDADADASHPLIPRRAQSVASVQSRRYIDRDRHVFGLDDIPPIIKSANGNIFWADEQCTRRVGLTATEARLFLCLLQTDEPEDYNYEEYKAMFEDFGKEQQRLEELVRGIHWWDFESYRQKAIWKARIDWLERMKEPRLWLLYLMARRRRILKVAAVRVMERLREKRIMKEENSRPPHRPSHLFSLSKPKDHPVRPIMVSDSVQTPEAPLAHDIPIPSPPVIMSEAASEHHLNITGTRQSMSEKLRSSFSSGHHSHSSHHGDPVFNKRLEATREGIKRQVELFMPKPKPYVVIGWFSTKASDPKERILQFEEPGDLFKALRHGEKDVRGWRRLASLKGLKGFGLYKCDISRGAHLRLVLNTSQKSVLSQFFLAYKASNRHADDAVAIAWQGWVHKNLNDCKNNPLEGRYSLELIYGWSSYRLSGIIGVPLLLSFVLPLWYMTTTGDVITAWTIGIYIVTAAAALIALMTILGSLGDN